MNQVTITRAKLVKALETWEREAAAGKWPMRPEDPRRHEDNADYLLDLLSKD